MYKWFDRPSRRRIRHLVRSLRPTSKLHVIPLKRGTWRTVWMTEPRRVRWQTAYQAWWTRKGHRLAISPEMWVE